MEKAKKPCYKYCFVPECKNTIKSTPHKVFFFVPRNAEMRKEWCKVVRRVEISPKSCSYCCEDHFNIEEDTANYVQYNIMKEQGQKVTLRLKEGVVPHIFQCQKKKMPPPQEEIRAINDYVLLQLITVESTNALEIETPSYYEAGQSTCTNALEIVTPNTSYCEAGQSTFYIQGSDDYRARSSTLCMDISETEQIEATSKAVQVNMKSKYRSKGVQVKLKMEKESLQHPLQHIATSPIKSARKSFAENPVHSTSNSSVISADYEACSSSELSWTQDDLEGEKHFKNIDISTAIGKDILYPEHRCRICLDATNGKIALNQTINYKKAEILLNELLEFCLNEQVCKNGKADGLCLTCMEKGIVCYEFKKKFEESHSILLKEIEEGNSFVIKTEDDSTEEDSVVVTENEILKEEILDDDVLVITTRNGVLEEEILDEEVLTENGEILKEEILDDDVFVVATGNGVLKEEILDEEVLTENGEILKEEILDDDVLVVATGNGVLQKEILDEEVLTENVEILKEEILDDDVFVVATGNGVLREEILDEVVLKQNNEAFETFFLRNLRKEEILDEKSQITENIKCHEDKQDILNTPGDKPTAITLQGKEHQCDICEETFQHSSGLNRHKRRHNYFHLDKKTVNKHKCEICGETFTYRASLIRHNLEHSSPAQENAAEFKCELCENTYKSKRTLNRHTQKFHKIGPVGRKKKKVPCPTCGKIFFKKRRLIVHMKTHSVDKKFICNICLESFTSSNNLTRHKRTHSVEGFHNCPECGKGFALKTSLRAHLSVHSRKRRNECQTCGIIFATPGFLSVHMKTHSAERRFKCTICTESFKYSLLLKNHMVLHTGVCHCASPCLCSQIRNFAKKGSPRA